MQDFKHIRAWQRAHALAIAIHKQTRHFTRMGYGHLRSQLTRAADSIAANIVEGCGAATNKEFARFLDMSIKSDNELEYHLLESRDLDLLDPATWQSFNDETIEIRKMTFVYRRKVLQSPRNSQSED
jgi:four helix bundle protein